MEYLDGSGTIAAAIALVLVAGAWALSPAPLEAKDSTGATPGISQAHADADAPNTGFDRWLARLAEPGEQLAGDVSYTVSR